MATPHFRPVDLKHEDVFAQRYGSLLRWARQLTNGNIALAQDLVHDAYVHFVLVRPDLSEIQSWDRYLYGMLRNLNISHLRRATRTPALSLAAVEYDSAEISLRQSPQGQMQVVEQLWQACEYACTRKETSRAGSVIILRFFHGYYPGEIAAITRNSSAAVSESLRAIREETVQYLRSAGALTCIAAGRVKPLPRGDVKPGSEEVLVALRDAILTTNDGKCFPFEKLKRIYSATGHAPVHKAILAHLVSCRACLEMVNRILGLSPLFTRDVMDMTGRDDDHWPGGPGDSSGGSSNFERGLKGARKEAQQVFEHLPRQLIVSVNGYYLATHSVKADHESTEFEIEYDQRIDFVEILSEQGLRLAFLSADAAPADQAGRISQHVELSDGRRLEVSVRPSGTSACLRVAFHDREATESLSGLASLALGPLHVIRARIESIRHLLFTSRGWWMRVVFASMILLLAGALIIRERQVSDPIALLRKADQKEQAATVDSALHRTVSLREESATGAVMSRRTIEIWQSAKLGRVSRRLYDQDHRLIAGEWINPDGNETIVDGTSEHRVAKHPFEPRFDDAWRFDPSAEQFLRLVNASTVNMETKPATYVVSLRPHDGSATPEGLVSVELTMARTTLRGRSAVLVIRYGGSVRTFFYEEIRAESKNLRDIDPSTFVPEHGPSANAPRPLRERPVGSVAIPSNVSLEIAVLNQLADVNADLGEDLTVAPLPDGRIKVIGFVETRRRKEDILQALHPLELKSPVIAELRTYEDGIARSRSPTRRANAPTLAVKLEATSSRAPLDAELRGKFRDQGVPEAELDKSVQDFSSEIVKSSLLALQHARALQNITSRFSAEQLSRASAAARMQWLGIVIRHAEALESSDALIDRRLGSIALISPVSGRAVRKYVETSEDLRAAAQRLLNLTVSNDRTLATGFSIPLSSTQVAAVNWDSFQRSLSEAVSLTSGVLDTAKHVRTSLDSQTNDPIRSTRSQKK
ncbi:MAG TPA: RNA polymerase sigma factor [Bryobacteraceae bacterium]|nr:RNA polymerase sigma factor [Bryobacteraceae bacterium]